MRKLKCALIALMGLFLAACSFLPEEEVYNTVIEPYRETVTVSYSTVNVERGDVLLTQRVNVRYSAVKRENLSFALSGARYDRFFVSEGDKAQTGDILAKLDTTAIDEKIDGIEQELKSVRMQREHIEEESDLLISRYTQRSEISRRDYDPRETEMQYEDRINDLNRREEVLGTQLEQCRQERETRLIRAPFAGTVTYVAHPGQFDVSRANERVIQLADMDKCVFYCTVKDWTGRDDEIYEIRCGNAVYETHYVTSEELDIEAKSDTAYFRLVVPSLELSENTSGNITLVMDSRRDVLYIPNGCVTSVNGRSAVYMVGEDGLKTVRFIETGLVGTNNTEVTEGLAEGEAIIR